jgi:hypothetical protein
MGQCRYVPVAHILADNFDELVDGHKHNQGIIKGEEDFVTIAKFLEDIRYFEKFGLSETEWNYHIHEKGLDVREVEEWIANMNKIVNSDIPALSKLRKEIKCEESEMKGLIQSYNAGKGL